MSDKRLPIVIGVVGLLAAWYWSRKQSQQLAGILSGIAQNPGILPSRQIGDGYLDPIVGSTGMAPVSVSSTGDVHAPYGTDVFLHAIDPWDPTIAELPNVHPVNGGLIDEARADLIAEDLSDLGLM